MPKSVLTISTCGNSRSGRRNESFLNWLDPSSLLLDDGRFRGQAVDHVLKRLTDGDHQGIDGSGAVALGTDFDRFADVEDHFQIAVQPGLVGDVLLEFFDDLE